MVSQRRLLNLLTVLAFIAFFVVACERPLTNSGDETDQTGQTDDANAGGGTDGSEDAGAGDSSGDSSSTSGDGAAAGGDSADETEGATQDTGSADSEAGGGSGDAGDTSEGAEGSDDAAEGDAGDDSAADDSAEGSQSTEESTEEATDEDATEESAEESTEDSSSEASDDTIPETHTVAAGENLYRIGLKYGISWVAIANENNLANPNVVTVGQVLKLPGAATPDPEPTPSPQTETTYIVKQGDNLYRIGRAFGISWVQIAEANGLVNPNLIKPGDELKIPVNTPGPAPQFSHVVKQGETLFLISLQYGVAWPTIAEANNLASPYVIYVGQTLEIPGSQ